MKSLWRGMLIGLFLTTMSAGTAFGWAWGTHAYITDNLGLDRLPAESNEMYGAVAPDVFNFLFSNPQLMEVLATATHVDGAAPWAFTRNQPEREFALGFASHNEAWGADMTAHQFGLTFGGPQFDNGYIIAKADQLLSTDFGQAMLNLGLPTQVTDLMAHILVENAIDLLIAESHPEIGQELTRAALHRNQLFPKLLVRAYGDLAPKGLIEEIEESFRSNLIAYGEMLQQEPSVAHLMMAALLVSQAKGYLSMFPGVPIPDDTALMEMANAGLSVGKALCTLDQQDYMTELGATIEYVNFQLESQGIMD